MADPPDLVRAVAAVVYGEPRFTRDVDIVVALEPGDATRLAAAFGAERHAYGTAVTVTA